MAKVFTITEGLENMGALKTGGQGSVYKARRVGHIISAVKLLPTPIYSESADDKNFLNFQNEVQKLQRVNQEPNPYVVKIINSGLTETGNLPFIEMEYIEGPDMEDLLKPPYDPVFSVKEVLKVADQLSCALSHCHKVDVKHGDIKSNNVKFNVNTGNYVLLDFGLAIMSEEQRRTSMRQAGAIEFMAPEQNEGLMYFQTDIYSYGIILFELLTGEVPFPLKDKGETARNHVMVAHMEKPVPDVLSLRRLKLPVDWTGEKKEREMQVPQWLINTIYKCLEKVPRDRFKNGVELHEYIMHHSTMIVGNSEVNALNATILQNENERLRTLLIQYQEAAKIKDSVALNPHKVLSLNEVLSNEALSSQPGNISEDYSQSMPVFHKRRSFGGIVVFLMILIALAGFSYKYRAKFGFGNKPTAAIVPPTIPKPVANSLLYKVTAPRAYFHNTPDQQSRRSAYLTQADGIITAMKESDEFIYTEYINAKNKISKGWLLKSDLQTVEENADSTNNSPPEEVEEVPVSAQLNSAARLIANYQYPEAMEIYNTLAREGVPEAMYQYGVMALRGNNNEVNCYEAIEWIIKAANKNYTVAKRTLGFLYMFAGNESKMLANDFNPCPIKKDTILGAKYLVAAISEGDSIAVRYLDQANKKGATFP